MRCGVARRDGGGAGLAPGDRVVIANSAWLRDGQPVTHPSVTGALTGGDEAVKSRSKAASSLRKSTR